MKDNIMRVRRFDVKPKRHPIDIDTTPVPGVTIHQIRVTSLPVPGAGEPVQVRIKVEPVPGSGETVRVRISRPDEK